MFQVELNDKAAKRFGVSSSAYLLETSNYDSLLQSNPELQAEKFIGSQPQGNDPLIIRSGGIGDLLMLSSLLPELIKKHGKVSVAAFNKCASVLENLPEHRDGTLQLIQYPVRVDDLEQFSSVTALEGIIESSDQHPIASMATELGMQLNDLPLPRFSLSSHELAAAKELLPPGIRPRIAIQIHASAKIRSLPWASIYELIWLLIRAHFDVVLFGDPNTWQGGDHRVFNMTDKGLSFRESAAVFSLCDKAITPDSAFVHLAAAMGIPCVGLYGAFPWKERTAHYPTVRSLQGWAKCAPCKHHISPAAGAHPTSMPCSEHGWCAAMEVLTPARIVTALKAL